MITYKEVLQKYNYDIETLSVIDIKHRLLKILKDVSNKKYNDYINKYPEIEKASFLIKFQEAILIENNPDISSTQTPYLSSITETIEERNSLAKSVIEKVTYLANMEKNVKNLRNNIENSNTVEDLENIDFSFLVN